MRLDSVIALGTFDGVHLGHKKLIDTALALAKERGLRPLIYTFSNHPMEAFGQEPRLLLPSARRVELLSGFCETVAVPFDRVFAAMKPVAFVKMLLERFSMKGAVGGFNYTFGCRGAGDMAMLRALGEELGFQACEIPPETYEGAPISSSRIRAALEAGRVEAAAAMLGRPFSLAGRVAAGKAIGHSLGFPTANLEPAPGLVLPAVGVYAVWAALEDGTRLPAVTNVGNNPTVGGERITVETHILGKEVDLYGQPLEVAFVGRLRGDVRFPSRAALSAQISRDAAAAWSLLLATQNA